jgi:predicted GTPase
MLLEYTKKELEFAFTSGTDFPQNTNEYALIIHCGGCMLTETEMMRRMEYAKKAGTPMTNYGTAIAYVNGILQRAIKPFLS